MLGIKFAIGATVLLLASAGFAQQPAVSSGAPRGAAPPPATVPLQVPNPHYVSIPMTIDVNAPVDKVWTRIGKYCDIGEWAGLGCTITSGTDGEFGAVRSVAGEILVGKTKYSYTYTQAPREGVAYNLYHGTLEAVALTDKTARLNYTLFFDNSMLSDDAAREADLANRRATFMRFLGNMKILAEGGALPPRPPSAGPRPGGSGGGAGRGVAPLMSPTPHYVSIPMTVEVNAPVAKVWARVGKYCDIGEWAIPGCTIISGTDGEFGAVRSIGNEVLVGKTKYSYIYAQPLRATGVYTMNHGTLEARALSSTTTQLSWTVLYDNSSIPDGTRETEMSNRRTRIMGWLNNMKTLSEGGMLPPGTFGRSVRPGTRLLASGR